MAWLKAQARLGILGQDWRTAAWSLALLGLGWLVSLGYAPLNHGPYVWTLNTPLDDLMPLLPPFVIPYISAEPLVITTALLLLLFRIRLFQSFALATTVATLISYGFFLFLQTHIVRPTLTGDDFFIQLIRQVYASDNPFNDFPSLHVALSTIVAIHLWRVDRRIGIPVAIWIVLIIMSTLFVKQHHIADVLGGLALAWAVSAFFLARLVDRAPTRAVAPGPAA